MKHAKLVYWLLVALVPALLFRFYRIYWFSIGCPRSGDCYEPGSEHLLSLELLILYSTVLLWPLVGWKLYSYASSLIKGKEKHNKPLEPTR